MIFGSIEDESLNGKIRVSIVATSLDGHMPQSKPVISMVHRLQSRNIGNVDNSINAFTSNQTTLNATEGATALDMNQVAQQENSQPIKKELEKVNEAVIEQNNYDKDPELQDVSIENAAYLQNIESTSNDEEKSQDKDLTPTFEVDSIELATPELFSEEAVKDETFLNKHLSQEQKELEIFEKEESDNNLNTKEESKEEPEMFENSQTEEDFEIPAFLRRQKN